jgi:hypothetical protein
MIQASIQCRNATNGTRRPSTKSTSTRTLQHAEATDASNASPPASPTAGCQPSRPVPGKRMRTIGTAANNECIWCHNTETQDHLFQCPHQSAWRNEFVERLDKHLTDSATEPTVKEEVLECTTSWDMRQQTYNIHEYNCFFLHV